MAGRTDYMNNTQSEIEFLDGIVSGKWRNDGSASKALAGYIATARQRIWNPGVNQTTVIDYAKALLKSIDGSVNKA